VIVKNSDVVLVTGAEGFLGTHVMAELKKERFEHVIGLRHADAELLDYAEVAETLSDCSPDVIIHLAGIVGGIGANKDNPGQFFFENMQMGLNVVHAAYRANIKRIIMIGTVCMYARNTPVPFAEEHLWFGYPEETNAPYGIAKRGLIQMCQSYNDQYGMQNVSLMPTNLFGPKESFNLNNSHVIPSLICKFSGAIANNQSEVILWGSGNVSREFLYVNDCAEAIVKAMRFCENPGPINLGTGKEITIKRLALMIADLMNYTGEIIWDTSKPDGQPRRCLKTDKALDFFNWKAKTHFVTGLVETILWYEEAVNNGSINNYI